MKYFTLLLMLSYALTVQENDELKDELEKLEKILKENENIDLSKLDPEAMKDGDTSKMESQIKELKKMLQG